MSCRLDSTHDLVRNSVAVNREIEEGGGGGHGNVVNEPEEARKQLNESYSKSSFALQPILASRGL